MLRLRLRHCTVSLDPFFLDEIKPISSYYNPPPQTQLWTTQTSFGMFIDHPSSQTSSLKVGRDSWFRFVSGICYSLNTVSVCFFRSSHPFLFALTSPVSLTFFDLHTVNLIPNLTPELSHMTLS